MRRTLSIAIVVSLLLLGAGYSVAKSFGAAPFSLTADGGSPATTTATPTVAAPTATPSPRKAIEDAAAILERLKTRPGQEASAKRGAPVQLPKRITIASIGVDSGFEFVGMAPDGAMDIPKEPQKVAWYRLGPRPGEMGNAVVAGHVDWGGKTAVFWRLAELNPGEVVEIVAVDEKRYQFIVQWQRWYDADKAPVERLFAQRGISELTMISCGGVFDQKTRQYLSRLVVRAVRR